MFNIPSIWKSFEPCYGKYSIWANFYCCKRPNIKKSSSHLVTLFGIRTQGRKMIGSDGSTKQPPLISYCFFKKNGPFPASFFFIFVFSIQLTVKKCSINFAKDWNRTVDFWYQKQPLYQLSHTTTAQLVIVFSHVCFLLLLWGPNFSFLVLQIGHANQKHLCPCRYNVITNIKQYLRSGTVWISTFWIYSLS